MLERDRNYSGPSSSSASSTHGAIEDDCLPTSEPGPSAIVEPKSAIDVALELIAQEELEAINAARIAALNKPKPRGRPPLSRKTAENTATVNAKTDLQDLRTPMKQKETEQSQVEASHSSILLTNGIESFPATPPIPILKDHFEVEAAARVEPQSMEVSLFGADNGEPESNDFHKMVLLNYGSIDGRLEDDEEEVEEEEGNGKEVPLPKESSPKKGSRKSEEKNSSDTSNRCETVATTPVRGPLPSLEGGSSSVEEKIEKSSPMSMETEEVKQPPAPLNSGKRGPYEKKGRGRPRKSREIISPPKTGRPRGRPRKDGGHSVRKVERKSVERKLHERLQKRRPRRAAAMIQDFLEFYAKVDLADLEFIHARATTFVRMLVDEYIEESKANSAKSSSRSDNQNSRSEAVGRKSERKGSSSNRDNQHYSSKRAQSVDMDVSAGPSTMDDMESAEEPESSAEEVGLEGGYDSSSDPNADYEENNVNDLPLGRTTSLSDSFIDSIPVIRGTVLQHLPTVVDSA